MTKAIDQAGGGKSRTSVERGRISRAKLLNAATELIPRVGWNAVTTRSLAAHAGVRPGLVHYHFDSLADLLRTAATEVFTEALEVPLEAMIATEDPTEGALAALRIMNGHGGKAPPPSCSPRPIWPPSVTPCSTRRCHSFWRGPVLPSPTGWNDSAPHNPRRWPRFCARSSTARSCTVP